MVVTLFINPPTHNFAVVRVQIDKYVPKPRHVKSFVTWRVKCDVLLQHLPRIWIEFLKLVTSTLIRNDKMTISRYVIKPDVSVPGIYSRTGARSDNNMIQ